MVLNTRNAREKFSRPGLGHVTLDHGNAGFSDLLTETGDHRVRQFDTADRDPRLREGDGYTTRANGKLNGRTVAHEL